jgi:ABC-type branched-subunit amino acid transport system permease subunit
METAVPLTFTALGGIGIVLVASYAVAPDTFALPPLSFWLGLAAAVLAALAVSMVTWPVLAELTRHDNVRFE